MAHNGRAELLDRVDCRVELRVGSEELSIQVVAGEGSPVVARDHTVWVSHWNHLEHHSLPQVDSFYARPSDEFEEALHNEARIRLSRVDTRANYDELFVLVEGQFAFGVFELRWVYFQR